MIGKQMLACQAAIASTRGDWLESAHETHRTHRDVSCSPPAQRLLSLDGRACVAAREGHEESVLRLLQALGRALARRGLSGRSERRGQSELGEAAGWIAVRH